MALARHHGLPTMLVDWSRRPRCAAYFAASEAVAAIADTAEIRARCLGDATDRTCALQETTDDLAVWALKVHEREQSWQSLDWHISGAHLEIYQAPAWANPNMRAQAGQFTIMSSQQPVAVEDFFAKWVLQRSKPSPLIKMTVPCGVAARLLRLLSYEDIDGASMFPGVDGIVRAMRERALWDKG
ncbi:MAG: FRG domain-containing protein, partial [Patescibacteria group bacterium]|nr:FRG domain-containing protein [Patescibacteria group bacterium]